MSGRRLPITPESLARLSPLERRNLTAAKWRYRLETDGYSREEAARLVFLRWLVHTGTAER